MKKMFKQIHLYTVLIYKRSPTFTDQMPTFDAFRKVHSMLSSSTTNVHYALMQQFFSLLSWSWRLDEIQYMTVERTEGIFQTAVTASVSFTIPSQAFTKQDITKLF